jgi:hypothetical protein
VYESAVVINDLLTGLAFAVLFCARGDGGLLFLAAGYLWTALLAAAHMLSFPGLFSESGLYAGPQTTAWLYMFWHLGFPASVLGYVIAGGMGIERRGPALIIAAAAVVITVLGLVALSSAGRFGGHDLLPIMMQANQEKGLASLVAGIICLIAAVALGRVWNGRVRLDLSLAVVMYAWIADVALSAVFNAGRYDLGWYIGRFFGFLAASLVLYQMLLLAVVEYHRRPSR